MRPVLALDSDPTKTAAIFDALTALPEDFMGDGREDTPPQEREAF